MIDKYEIKKVGNREVLYLYLDINNEFSWQNLKENTRELKDTIKDFIVRNNIIFKGEMVNIIIGGVFIGHVILNNYHDFNKKESLIVSNEPKYVSKEIINNDVHPDIIESINRINKEKSVISEKNASSVQNTKQNNTTKKNNSSKTSANTKNISKTSSNTKNISNTKSENVLDVSNDSQEVDNNIYISLNRNGNIEKIELETYIIGVVGAEMPALFHIEALKAQAIIARTYALKAYSQGKILKSNESNQSYKTNAELKKLWGNNYNTYYNKIKNAVLETKGVYLSYKGNYIEAVYHSTSNGKTESSSNVWGNSYPYLVSVESKYDNLNSSFSATKKISYNELSKILKMEVNMETEILILDKTSGNRVNKISINDKIYKGVEFRNLLGLRSADFDIEKEEDGIVFTTRGYGHGVGLSQYGANGYAKNGMNYKNILLHYYPGVSLKNQ